MDDVSKLLRAWTGGDRNALEDLIPIVYRELRRLARHYRRGERPGHSLQTTALVNEAYCAWWIISACTGRIVPTSSPSPPS